jgi:hypothetical protein
MLSTGRKCTPHKAEDTYTATRARGGGAPEGAPPRPGELAVKESEEMCLVKNRGKTIMATNYSSH